MAPFMAPAKARGWNVRWGNYRSGRVTLLIWGPCRCASERRRYRNESNLGLILLVIPIAGFVLWYFIGPGNKAFPAEDNPCFAELSAGSMYGLLGSPARIFSLARSTWWWSSF